MSIVAAIMALFLSGALFGKKGADIPQPDKQFKTGAEYSPNSGNGPVWLPPAAGASSYKAAFEKK